MISGLECDVLVVGHGAAGCLAGAALAERGMEVILVGRGTTATELSTSRITVPEDQNTVASLFRRVGEGHGLFLCPPGRAGAITNLGTISAQDLSSTHDWLATSRGTTAVLGLKDNEFLDPDLLCRSLTLRLPSVRCEAYWAGPSLPMAIDAGAGSLSEEALEAVDSLAGPLSELGQDMVVLPPLFLGPQHVHALDRLERISGRQVREPATPLSVPGRRLQACLEEHALRSGCRLLKGREVRTMLFDRDLATGAVIASGLRQQEVSFRAALLGVGGLAGSGLGVIGDRIVDPMGAFAVEGLGTGELLTSALSSGLLRRGALAVRPDGTAVKNVFPAGSCVPGMSLPLGAGLGEVASSALEAAALIMEAL